MLLEIPRSARNDTDRERDVRHSEWDRKSTRLNSSHEWISYAVFCLKKKNRVLSDALVTRNVLSLDRLSNIRFNPKPDHRGGHLFLRNYAAFFPRFGSVHSARCELRNARPTGVLLCDRTYGDVLAWSDRYTANHSLREHDHRDAGAHAPGISIPQMEALSDG